MSVKLMSSCTCSYVYDGTVLGQCADWRLGLNDLLIGQLLLKVSPGQTPQMVHLINGPL